MPFTVTWMDLKGVMLSDISQKKTIPYDFIYMWNLNMAKNEPIIYKTETDSQMSRTDL